jgi:hypothetical protein
MAPECALEACFYAGVLWVDGAKEDAYSGVSFFLKIWVCVLSEYISFTGFNVSLDMYLHTLFAFLYP